MKTLNGKRCLFPTLASLMLAASMTGCGLMHDDLEDCATRPSTHTSVKFVYDYNTSTKDMFNDHVGAVTLYVFDSTGGLIQQIERTNHDTNNSLKSPGFQIDLDLTPGKYTVYAVAEGNPLGYEKSLDGAGAKFRRQALTPGDRIDAFARVLDNESGIVNNAGVLIDTIWTSMEARELVIPEPPSIAEGEPQQPDSYVEATIPLMRLTNNVHISFHQTDFPTALNIDDYDLWVTYPTGTSKFDIYGNYTADAIPLTFHPYNRWNDKDESGKAFGHMTLGLPRFIYGSSEADRPTLHIRNKITSHETLIDFVALLAQGRDAFAPHNWSQQEYLDREYDYDLALYLDDNIWKYAMVKVNILSWTKRVQNEELH